MRVPHHKLVRDRIPEIIQAEGHHPVTRVLDDSSYQAALLAKYQDKTVASYKKNRGAQKTTSKK